MEHFRRNLACGHRQSDPIFAGKALIIVNQDPLGGALNIVVLAAPQRPYERQKANYPEKQGDRYQIGQDVHASNSFATASLKTTAGDGPAPRRSAFPITSSDDADIAMAAISGVT